MFGKALEESIQFHHDHYGLDPVKDFEQRWAAHRDNKEITYTNTEQNWETCNLMGRDMIRLYVAVQPSLPIPLGARSVFQREYEKEVFPGDPNYGGIQDAGKLDIVCYADVDHPMLPKISQPQGAHRTLIVDIKTSAVDFPEQPGMAGFDTQLRRYSWLSGIRDVSLLWFVKKGLGYKKGYSVTVIEPIGNFKAGQEAVIAKVDEQSQTAWIVANDFLVEEMERVQGRKGDRLDTTNEAKTRVNNWIGKFATRTPLSGITKQRLQFNCGRVTENDARDAGQIAGRQIQGIVNASKNKEWPNTFGIRYPRDDRNDSYFRGFVLKEPGYVEVNFTRVDETTLDDLFAEDSDL